MAFDGNSIYEQNCFIIIMIHGDDKLISKSTFISIFGSRHYKNFTFPTMISFPRPKTSQNVNSNILQAQKCLN